MQLYLPYELSVYVYVHSSVLLSSLNFLSSKFPIFAQKGAPHRSFLQARTMLSDFRTFSMADLLVADCKIVMLWNNHSSQSRDYNYEGSYSL